MQLKKIDVSYSFYLTECICGSEPKICEDAFECYISRAKLEVEPLITAEISENYEEKIKLLLCEVAEELYLNGGSGNKKSESIEGYSVTYADADIRKKLLRIVIRRIGNTGLLYAGVVGC